MSNILNDSTAKNDFRTEQLATKIRFSEYVTTSRTPRIDLLRLDDSRWVLTRLYEVGISEALLISLGCMVHHIATIIIIIITISVIVIMSRIDSTRPSDVASSLTLNLYRLAITSEAK
jgi:hypothetical protein